MRSAAATAALVLASLGVTGIAAASPAERYDFDTAHSSIGFSARFMGVSNVRGTFSKYSGTLMYLPDDPTRSTVSLVIDAASVFTGNDFRDRHLRSPDFFAADSFKTIRFTSERIEKSADGFVVHGPLTIRDVTRPVSIALVQYHAPVSDAWGNTRMGFSGEARVSRKAFNVLGTTFWNSEFDPGRFSVGDEITIELDIQARISNMDRWSYRPGEKRPLMDSLAVIHEAKGERALAKALEKVRATGADVYDLSGSSLMVLGRRLLQHGHAAGAVVVFRNLTELHPEDAGAFDNLAEAQLAAGDTKAAAASSAKALALDPDLTSAMETRRWAK